MRTLKQEWRAVVASVGVAAVIATAPTGALARATKHAGSAAPAATSPRANAVPPAFSRTSTFARPQTIARANVTSMVRLAAFSSSYGGHAKKSYMVGSRELASMGARITLHDGVYYHGSSKFALSKNGKARYAMHGRSFRYGFAFGGGEGSLQCVPFARAASGIELKGNAANWWDAAAGVYERGVRPEPGSVLNFRATGTMRLGHVAVVADVVSPREIEIDHANWAGAGAYKGGVARGVHVVDVSPDNDWSEVRVALGNGDYGSTYPTYGFIYDRPDDGGTMLARARHVGFRNASNASEVAEAPRR